MPAFEKALAEALSASPLPADVSVWDRALRFGWDGQELAYVLSVAVPLEKVFLEEKPPAEKATTGTFEGTVSILLRVKDAAGKVVTSFSQRFPLSGPSDQLARVRAFRFPSSEG